jgi:hypothetical protein
LNDKPEKPRWYLSFNKYVKEAIRNVKVWLSHHNKALKSRAPTVIPSGCRTSYCKEDEGNYFQQQVGVLRWIVELGRINIAVEVSMLASYTNSPRIGHFDAILHIFSHLNQHDKSKLVFDDSYVTLPDPQAQDWS